MTYPTPMDWTEASADLVEECERAEVEVMQREVEWCDLTFEAQERFRREAERLVEQRVRERNDENAIDAYISHQEFV